MNTVCSIQDRAVLRPKPAMTFTGQPSSSFYAKQQLGNASYDPTFPRPVALGPRSKGYLLRELQAWLEQKAAERNGK